jgi:hypothetical protein
MAVVLVIGRENLKHYRSQSLPYVRNAEDLRARRASSDRRVPRIGGDLLAKEGDWIVRDAEGTEDDIWPVAANAFAGSYDLPGSHGEPEDERRCVSMGWTSLCLMPTDFELEAQSWHLGPPHRGVAGDYLAIGPGERIWVVNRSTVEDRLTLIDDPAPGKRKFFLSYAHDDTDKIGEFLGELQYWLQRDERGVVAFLDVGDIGPGDKWATSIAGQIAWADFFIVVVGPKWIRQADHVARRFELPLALLAEEEHGCKIAAIHDQSDAGHEELERAATSLTGTNFRLAGRHNQIIDMSDRGNSNIQVGPIAKKLVDASASRDSRIAVTYRRTEEHSEASGQFHADELAPTKGSSLSRTLSSAQSIQGPRPDGPTLTSPASTIARGQGTWRLWPDASGLPDLIGVVGRTLTLLGTGERVLEFDGDVPSAMVGSDDRTMVLVQTTDGLLVIEAGSRSPVHGRRRLTARPIEPIDDLESLLAVRRDGRALTMLYIGGGKTWECRVDGQGHNFGRRLQLDSVVRIAAPRPTSFFAYDQVADRPVLGFVEPALQRSGAAPIAVASCVEASPPRRGSIALLTEFEGQRVVTALTGAGSVRTFPVDDDADSVDVVSCSGEVFVGVGSQSTVSLWSLSNAAWAPVG